MLHDYLSDVFEVESSFFVVKLNSFHFQIWAALVSPYSSQRFIKLKENVGKSTNKSEKTHKVWGTKNTENKGKNSSFVMLNRQMGKAEATAGEQRSHAVAAVIAWQRACDIEVFCLGTI